MKSPGFRLHSPLMKRKVFIIFLISILFFAYTGVARCATGEEHGESQGAKGWVATDTYRVMNFVVLAVILFLLLRKPVSQALTGRIRGIQDQLSELEEKKREAEAQLARYQEKLSVMDKEADKIISEYINQGKEAKARILKEAKAATKKIEEQARRNIEHEFNLVRKKLQVEILEKALAKAEGIIKDKITTEDQDRLVDDYLDKVVNH